MAVSLLEGALHFVLSIEDSELPNYSLLMRIIGVLATLILAWIAIRQPSIWRSVLRPKLALWRAA